MSRPSVSVVVATRDRPAALAVCLRALAELDYPAQRLELVVVDDGTRAPLDDVLAEADGRMRLVRVRTEGVGPAGARNAGVAAARGDVLAFTDDDCVPEPSWLARLVPHLNDHPRLLVGGRTRNGLPHRLFPSASQHIGDLVYAHYNRSPDDALFLGGNNVAFARGPFEQLGGFAAARYVGAAAEDRDLVTRWRRAGWPARYVPDAVVWHHHAMGLAGFVRQHFHYGQGAALYHAAHGRHGPTRAETLAFYGNRRLWSASLRPPRRALRLAGPLLIWQLANASGFAWQLAVDTTRRR